MPNLYVRHTVLTDLGGRIDYISSPKRQENLLAVHDGAADKAEGTYWRQLAAECQEGSKYTAAGKKNIQGRELHLALSNSLLDRLTPDEIARELAESFEQKYNRSAIVAVHWNKTKSNLHAHLIFGERELLKEPKEKVAPRALFFDEQGQRRYKKAEILDGQGDVRPGCRIVAKGEIYERKIFGPVDRQFGDKHQAWLKTMKSEWLLPLRNGVLHGDVEITEYDPSSGKLAYQHVGNKAQNMKNGMTKAQIEAYNAEVKSWNQNVDKGLLPVSVAVELRPTIAMRPQKNTWLRRINVFVRHWWDVEIRAKAAKDTPTEGRGSIRSQLKEIEQNKEVLERQRWINVPAETRLSNALRKEFIIAANYEKLAEKASTATEKSERLLKEIKAAEQRMKEISLLEKHIVNYVKTKDTYAAYRKAGYSKAFLAEHDEEIRLCKAAKAFFDASGLRTLPTIKSLKVEYAALLEQKNALYPEYKKAREEASEFLAMKKSLEKQAGIRNQQKAGRSERER